MKMQVPCETPIIMTGTDADGMAIAHDAMLALAAGGGDAHLPRLSRRPLGGARRRVEAPAAERFAATLAARTNPPLPRASDAGDLRRRPAHPGKTLFRLPPAT